MDIILEADIFTYPMVSFIAGLIFCVLGRKLLGFLVILFGFFIGYGWLSPWLAEVTGSSLSSSPWIRWICGALGAALGLVAWKVSMFFAGAVVGLFAARGLLPGLHGIVHVAIAILAGFLVHVQREPVLALLTATAGSYIATGSAMIMLEDIGFVGAVASFLDASNPAPVIAAVLLVIFVIVGYKFQARSFGS
ncbi:MAG: hypothetical protein R6U39_06290 [Candidatus Aegiribacteria sp.]